MSDFKLEQTEASTDQKKVFILLAHFDFVGNLLKF